MNFPPCFSLFPWSVGTLFFGVIQLATSNQISDGTCNSPRILWVKVVARKIADVFWCELLTKGRFPHFSQFNCFNRWKSQQDTNSAFQNPHSSGKCRQESTMTQNLKSENSKLSDSQMHELLVCALPTSTQCKLRSKTKKTGTSTHCHTLPFFVLVFLCQTLSLHFCRLRSHFLLTFFTTRQQFYFRQLVCLVTKKSNEWCHWLSANARPWHWRVSAYLANP